jgi:hypothetical protein
MRIWNRLCDITALRVFTVVILALVTCSAATAADTAGRVYKIGFLGQTSATDLSRQTVRYGKVFGIWDMRRAGTLLSNIAGLSGSSTACQVSRLSLLL